MLFVFNFKNYFHTFHDNGMCVCMGVCMYVCMYVFAIFRQASAVHLNASLKEACVNNDKVRPQHRALRSILFARSARVL